MKDLADSNGNGIIDQLRSRTRRHCMGGAGSGRRRRTIASDRVLGRSLCIGTDGNLWVGLLQRPDLLQGTFVGWRHHRRTDIHNAERRPAECRITDAIRCLIDSGGTLWSASLSSILGKIENTKSDTGPYTVSSFNSGRSFYGIGLGNGKVHMGQGIASLTPPPIPFRHPEHVGGSLGIVRTAAATSLLAHLPSARYRRPAHCSGAHRCRPG